MAGSLVDTHDASPTTIRTTAVMVSIVVTLTTASLILQPLANNYK